MTRPHWNRLCVLREAFRQKFEKVKPTNAEHKNRMCAIENRLWNWSMEYGIEVLKRKERNIIENFNGEANGSK